MDLSEGWLKILDFNNCKNLTNGQVYSMLLDYGVFKEYPKLRLSVKVALEYGLWGIINSKDNDVEILKLRDKLINEGFSDEVINIILSSFSSSIQHDTSDFFNEDPQKNSYNSRMNNEKIFGYEIKQVDDNTLFLNEFLFYVPEYNKKIGITIHNLNCIEKRQSELKSTYSLYSILSNKSDKPVVCIEYDITTDATRTINLGGLQSIGFYALTYNKNGCLDSKTYITSINTKEKYAITKGLCEINTSLSVNEISKIIFVPEIGDLELNTTYISSFDNYSSNSFEKFNGTIEIEPLKVGYNDINIAISEVNIWGKDNKCSISFNVKGNSTYHTGWRIGKSLTLALFNEKNRLIGTSGVFVGEKGYLGPRGGCHETYMSAGPIELIYLKYLDLDIDFSEIHKVIISQSKS